MKLVSIDKKDWEKGIERLRPRYRLFGPIREKTYHAFQRLDEGQLPDLAFANTRLSPKDIVFPQSKAILECSLDETKADHHIMKSIAGDDTPQLVLGIRPCDASALTLLDLNFNTDEVKDPYWIQAREKTTFFGLACDTPQSTCFCTSVGGGPFDEKGLDVLLVDADDRYLAKILTEKGAAAMQAAGWQDESDANALLERRRGAAEERIRSVVHTDRLKDIDILRLHGAPFWEDISFACINCGTCTYLCPTCWCFDIQDEVHQKTACRMKNWDSCMYPLFTHHTSGHNPRGTKLQRLRQRFMHKLKYFVDKHDAGIMCVGCGRCVHSCPVNIDIRHICNLMNQYSTEDACEAQG